MGRTIASTFPEGMLKHKSLKIRTSGLVEYLKLTFCNSMSPFTIDKVVPSLLLESILGLLSRSSKIEAVESLALLVSGAMAVASEIANAKNVKAK